MSFLTNSEIWKARTVDVTGMPWFDVDTFDALREAERRLMRDQNSKIQDVRVFVIFFGAL